MVLLDKYTNTGGKFRLPRKQKKKFINEKGRVEWIGLRTLGEVLRGEKV